MNTLVEVRDLGKTKKLLFDQTSKKKKKMWMKYVIDRLITPLTCVAPSHWRKLIQHLNTFIIDLAWH